MSSSSSSNPVDPLLHLAQSRRTIYALNSTSPIPNPDKTITDLLESALLNVPSSFNTQSTRLVLLLREEHCKLWDLVIESFEPLRESGTVSDEMWGEKTLPKLLGLRGAVGTILFYEDPSHIEPFSGKFPMYKEHFAPWADHSNAMHQYFLWTGLEALGFGANLQHYNPLIDSRVAKKWDIPTDWRLVAQLVFGGPEGKPSEKVQKPIKDRLRVYGSSD